MILYKERKLGIVGPLQSKRPWTTFFIYIITVIIARFISMDWVPGTLHVTAHIL